MNSATKFLSTRIISPSSSKVALYNNNNNNAFGCGEGGHAGSRSERRCLLKVCGESTVVTTDEKAKRRRK